MDGAESIYRDRRQCEYDLTDMYRRGGIIWKRCITREPISKIKTEYATERDCKQSNVTVSIRANFFFSRRRDHN